ncbi:DEAD/DEAH box helicase [Tsukamurella soli]
MHRLVDELTREVILRDFGAQTTLQGFALSRVIVSVTYQEVGTDLLVVETTVPGPPPVHVVLDLFWDGHGLVLTSDCTCPAEEDCLHGAALALSLMGLGTNAGVADRRPQWQAGLDALLADLGTPSAPEHAPMPIALQFETVTPDKRGFADPTDRIAMRVVRRGKSGKWVKSGISWRDVGARFDDRYDDVAVAALAALKNSLQDPGYYYASAAPTLREAGPAFWAALNYVIDCGVQVVGGGALDGVELVDGTVELRADAATDGQGDVRIALGVDLEGRFVSGEDLVPIGRPAHGVGVLSPGQRPGRSVLQLVRLHHRLPEVVSDIVADAGYLTVPVADREKLAENYLPRLARALPVGSTDGTVTFATPEPPRLALLVEWQGHDRAALDWQWRYRAGDRDRIFALTSRDGMGDVRLLDTERALLAALDLDEFARELLTDAAGLMPRRQLRGFEVVIFAGTVLPDLRERVEVHETGDQTTYEEVQEPPELTFDLIGDETAADTDWLDLQVRIDVAGESVPLPTVLAALTMHEPFLLLPSGRYLRTDIPEFERLADLVEAAAQLHDRGARDRLRVGRGDLGTWAALDDLGTVDARAADWVAAARKLQEFDGLPEIEPTGVVSTLREYQLTGFRWLAYLWDAGLGGVLADDMGLGKTVQTLALIAHARVAGAGTFLVVAPTSVVDAWTREAATHTPGLTVRAVTALAGRRGTSLRELADGADVLVTSYTLFRLESDAYYARRWGGLILDEAQAIKNRQGKTYQAVRDLPAPFRLAITGTPFENRLMELWSLLSVVAPGLYPRAQQFTDLVARPVEKEGDQVALQRLRRRIRPFLLRRTKELVAADLPPKQEQVLEVPLGRAHRQIYDTYLQRERQNVLGLVDDFDRNRVQIFAAITRLRMMSLDPALVDAEYDAVGSAKIDALVEHLTELAAEGHRALVFSQFTRYLARVKTGLDAAGIGWVYLDGRTRDRPARIASFRDGDAPAFLISLKAGGTGLTLTEADYVFVLDPWWNPAVEAQAVDRAHRIGQTRSVNVYRLVATDTIEVKVMELKERKAALFEQVVGGENADIAGMTVDDVRGLFEA